MITEFAVATGLVYTYNRIKYREKYKIKQVFNDVIENNNMEYKLLKIQESQHGYKLIVSLYGEGFDKLENSTDLLKCSFGHDLFIEQNNNLKTATINIFTKKLDDNIKFSPYKIEPNEVYFGLSYKFEPLIVDMNQFPHILVSGQTGCGKSELMRLILTNLISNHEDRDINIYFSDLADTCDFDAFKYCKQVKGHAKDLCESKELFEYMMHIYTKRLNIFSKKGCKNIKEYNDRYHEKRMAYIYLVLDEFADFFPVNKAEDGYEYKVICYNVLRHIIRKARKAGIFMIIGIQRPDTTVLDPSLKSGLCTKIGFSQNNQASSLVVADTVELTNIENRKALLMAGNKREWFRSLYITDKIINNYIKNSKTYNNKDFNKFIISTTEQLEELKELKEKISHKPTIKPKSKSKVKVKK